MEPSVMDMRETEEVLYFTISNINVSYANAIRRVIISDIPTVVIRTFPYEKNDANFEINTTGLNNEILKQRLSCIPIFIKDLDTELSDYLLEVDVENTTDQMIFVTTGDFKIKNIKTDKYLKDETVANIFPPNKITEQFIDFCRLKPAYSDNIRGEHLKFNAKLSIGTAGENGSFNVVSCCAYANTPDKYKINQERISKLDELNAKYDDEEEVSYQIKDWDNLDAKRIFVANSFDFKMKSLGVFTNNEIVVKAIRIIIERLLTINDIYSKANTLINNSETTIENCFDITLKEQDYTIGKIIEYSLYELYYLGDKSLTFCGFRKPHPHINESIIRIAFREDVDKNQIASYINNAIELAVNYFKKLLPHFGELHPDEIAALQSSIPQIRKTKVLPTPSEAPAEEAPAKEVPAKEVPAEEAPAEEAPAEEAPAEEAPTETKKTKVTISKSKKSTVKKSE